MPKEKVKSVELRGQTFRYMDYELGGGIKKSNFVILADGKATLCGRYTVKFFEEEPAKGYADPVRARFDEYKETYWVSVNEAPAQPIMNTKKFIEMFKDKKSEIQTYISKEKLGVKKAEDLKQIINYYNSL